MLLRFGIPVLLCLVPNAIASNTSGCLPQEQFTDCSPDER